jgi:hypothetical protein
MTPHGYDGRILFCPFPSQYPMLKASPSKPLLIACGLSFALVGCGETTQTGFDCPGGTVTIQPIQVCDDFGLFCADLGFFLEETSLIWSQAGIDVVFLPTNQLFDTTYLTIDSQAEFYNIAFNGPAGAFGRSPVSTPTSGPINMWFVEDIIISDPYEAFGLAWIDQNGVLISDDTLAYNRGEGRRDTVAHEVGHNLGLTHSDYGAGSSNNLMTSGTTRAIPSSTEDITPNGARLSRLTDDQINVARCSNFVTASGDQPLLPLSGDVVPPAQPLLEDGAALDSGVAGADLAEDPGAIATVSPWSTPARSAPLTTLRAKGPVDAATPLTAKVSAGSGGAPLPTTAPNPTNPTTAGTSQFLPPSADRAAQSVPDSGGIAWISSVVLGLGLWHIKKR